MVNTSRSGNEIKGDWPERLNNGRFHHLIMLGLAMVFSQLSMQVAGRTEYQARAPCPAAPFIRIDPTGEWINDIGNFFGEVTYLPVTKNIARELSGSYFSGFFQS